MVGKSPALIYLVIGSFLCVSPLRALLHPPDINIIHQNEHREAQRVSDSLSLRSQSALAATLDTRVCDNFCRQAGSVVACMTGHPAPDVTPYVGRTYADNVADITADFAAAAHEACTDILTLRREPHFFAKGTYMGYEIIRDGSCTCLARRSTKDRFEDGTHLARRQTDNELKEIDGTTNAPSSDTNLAIIESGLGSNLISTGSSNGRRQQNASTNSRWQRHIEDLDAKSSHLLALGKQRLTDAKDAYREGDYMECARHASCALGHVLASNLTFWASAPAAAARIGELVAEDLRREHRQAYGKEKSERRSVTGSATLPVCSPGDCTTDNDVEPRFDDSLHKRAPISHPRGSRSLSPVRGAFSGAAETFIPAESKTFLQPEGDSAKKPGWLSFFSFDRLMAYLSAIGAWFRKFPISIHPPPFDVLIHPAPEAEGIHRGLDDSRRSTSPLFRGMPRVWISTRPDHNHIEARIGGEKCRIPLPSMLGRPAAQASSQYFDAHTSRPNSRWCNVLVALFGVPSSPPHSTAAHPPPYAYPPRHASRTKTPTVSSSSQSSNYPARVPSYASVAPARPEPPIGYPFPQHAGADHTTTVRSSRPRYRSGSEADPHEVDNHFGVPARYHSGRELDHTSEYDSGSDFR